MARALHPELVKRIVVSDEVTEREWIDGMGVTKLVGGTRRGFGREIPEEDRRTDVTIFDITGRPATVKLAAGPWGRLHAPRPGRRRMGDPQRAMGDEVEMAME